MKKKEQVKRGDIVAGKPLPRDIYNEAGLLLLKKGRLLKSQIRLNALLARGLYFISEETAEEPVQESPVEKSIKEPSPFELIEDIYVQLSALFRSRGINTNFPFRVLNLSKQIQRTCQMNADASLGAIFLYKEGNYSITHQIHCAIICEIISTHLGRSPQERLPLLAAALTMNIAMIELQDTLFNRKEPLNVEERREVQLHPQRGAEFLKKCGVTDTAWLTAVLQHHEYMDGSGYPQGLHGDGIDRNASILTLSDVYGTKLSPRAYRDPLPPNVATREIFTGSRGQCFDQDMVRTFIKELGIFHPGSFVRLANGEIALVTHRGEKIHIPVVNSIARADGVSLPAPMQRDCSKDEFTITESLAPKKVNVSLNKPSLWGY